MLFWLIFFLIIITLVGAHLGISSSEEAASGIANILFGVFLVLFVSSFFFGRRIG